MRNSLESGVWSLESGLWTLGSSSKKKAAQTARTAVMLACVCGGKQKTTAPVGGVGTEDGVDDEGKRERGSPREREIDEVRGDDASRLSESIPRRN